MRTLHAQWKTTLLVFLVLVGTLSAVVWKTQDLLLEDKMSFLIDSSIRQIAPIKRLVRLRLDEEKHRLVRFAAAKASHRNSVSGDFEVISLVKPVEGGQWTPDWVEKTQLAATERWPAGHELTLLKSLPYNKVQDGAITWVRVSDSLGAPVYAILVAVEVQASAATRVASASSGAPPASIEGNSGSGQVQEASLPEDLGYAKAVSPAMSGSRAVVVGFSSANPLAAIADDSIGSTNTIFLVDDRGYVASHTNKAYQGALFTEDPMVKDILKTQAHASTGEYEDLESRPVLGHFERIDQTNLYATISTPKVIATGIIDAYWRVALVSGMGVGLIGLVLAFLFGRTMGGPSSPQMSPALTENQSSSEQKDQPIAQSVLGRPDNDPAEESDNDPDDDAFQPLSLHSAKTEMKESLESKAELEAFKTGLAETVKEPLLAILGHAQLAKSKAEGEEAKAHAESIEREARRVKEVIERLEKFSEATSAESAQDSLETMDLRAAVEAAIENAQEVIGTEQIEVVKKIGRAPRLRGSADEIEIALDHMIANAIEAMELRPEKRLSFELEDLGEHVVLTISDTGIGMSRDVCEKAFEPFFKEFESPERMGLGLTFVQSSLKRLGATCEIKSTPGEGAHFVLKFPVSVEERKAFQASAVLGGLPALDDRAGAHLPPAPSCNEATEVENSGRIPELGLGLALGLTIEGDTDDIDDTDDENGPFQMIEASQESIEVSGAVLEKSSLRRSPEVKIRRPKMKG